MHIPLHCTQGNVQGSYYHLAYHANDTALVSFPEEQRISTAGCMFEFEPSDEEDGDYYICYVIDGVLVVPFSDAIVYVFVLDMTEESKFQCLLDGSLPSVMSTVTNDKNVKVDITFDRISEHLEEYRNVI